MRISGIFSKIKTPFLNGGLFSAYKKLLYDRYNNRFLYFTQVVKAQFYDCDARE